MSTKAAEDTFEFDESDFRPSGEHHSQHRSDDFDELPLNESDSFADESAASHEPVLQKPGKGGNGNGKDRTKLYIGAAIAGAIAVMSGLGFVAYQVLAPHQRPPMAQSSMRNPTSDFAAVRSAPQQQGSAAIAPVQLDRQPVAQPPSERIVQPVREPRPQPVVNAPVIDTQAVVTRDGQQEAEDTFYDNMAKAAETNDADEKPAAAQSAAQVETQPAPVVSITPAQNAQIAALAEQMSKQSAENANVLEAVKALSRDVGAMRSKLDANDDATKQLGQKVNDLSNTVEANQKSTQARIDAAIKTAAENFAGSIKKQNLVLVGGAIEHSEPVRQPRRQEAPRPAPKPVATPAPVLALVEAPKPERVVAQPAQASGVVACQASTVSQNWKVKGVSTGAAYVRREDGEALLLRIDSEVPGFGRVKSFDPTTRTVCTTNGLIGR